MVDRFNNGNIQNDQPTKNPDILPKANYFGGDIEGIKKKISDGYFSNLGINTIWISPIVQNALGAYGEFPEPFTRFSAYHGYWPTSFTKIDFHFGTSQDFHNLVETAHNSNLNILLDFVANHVHEKHPIYKKHPDWATSLYLPDGTLNTEKWDEHRLTTWFDTFLPTLDLSKPEVYEMLSDSAVFWIKEYNIDGFRHDATKHIPEVFWRTLTKKLKLQIRNTNSNIYQIGETYGTRELIGTYINSGELDAQFDFNIYDDAVAVFAKDDESFERLSNSLNESFKYYGNHHLMGNITGNQDRPRFITYASGAITFAEDSKKAGWTREINVEDKIGYKKMALLSAFVMTIPGIPIIFYGDEFGMVGANDPDNRRMMRFDNLNDDENILRDITSKLISLRKNNLPLIYGDTKILKVTKKTFVFARTYFDQIAIVVFNKSNNSNTIDFEIPDRFSGKKFKASFNSKWKISENNMEIEIAGNSFEVILF
jgi:glycosidase